MSGRHRKRHRGRAVLIVALALLAAGGYLLARAVTSKPQQPPLAAQAIPRSVPTTPPPSPRVSPSPGKKGAAKLAPSKPVRLVIPAISVNAPVEVLGLNPDKTVQVPPLGDHNLAGWYDGSVTPGQRGPSGLRPAARPGPVGGLGARAVLARGALCSDHRAQRRRPGRAGL